MNGWEFAAIFVTLGIVDNMWCNYIKMKIAQSEIKTRL